MSNLFPLVILAQTAMLVVIVPWLFRTRKRWSVHLAIVAAFGCLLGADYAYRDPSPWSAAGKAALMAGFMYLGGWLYGRAVERYLRNPPKQ